MITPLIHGINVAIPEAYRRAQGAYVRMRDYHQANDQSMIIMYLQRVYRKMKPTNRHVIERNWLLD